MIIKMFLVADPLLAPADGVQVGGGGVGRPAEHLQHQRVEPSIIISYNDDDDQSDDILTPSRPCCHKRGQKQPDHNPDRTWVISR